VPNFVLGTTLAVVFENLSKGMILDDETGAAWTQVVSNDFRPPLEIGKPGERALGSEHDIEFAGQGLRQIIDVGQNEIRRNAQFLAQPAGDANRLG
jgi:hypothetical protein